MKIPVVNTKDEIIEYKERDLVDLEKDIVRSSSLWIKNTKGQVLLAQRKMTKRTDPGRWAEAVGGTVEGDDDYESTIYREAEEELGIRNERFIAAKKQFVAGPPVHYFVQWYTTTLDWHIEEFVIQETEVERVAWFDLAFLKADMKAHSDKYISALPAIVTLLEEK